MSTLELASFWKRHCTQAWEESARLKDALESAIRTLDDIDSKCEKLSGSELGDMARLGKWDARDRAALSTPSPVVAKEGRDA